MILSMANRYYTQEQIRAALNRKLEGSSQIKIARECGAKPQHISLMVNGAPIGGKVLAWLGFKKIENLYEKAK